MKYLRGLIANKLLWWAYLIYDFHNPIKDRLRIFMLINFPFDKNIGDWEIIIRKKKSAPKEKKKVG